MLLSLTFEETKIWELQALRMQQPLMSDIEAIGILNIYAYFVKMLLAESQYIVVSRSRILNEVRLTWVPDAAVEKFTYLSFVELINNRSQLIATSFHDTTKF